METIETVQVEKIFTRSVWVGAKEGKGYTVFVRHNDGESEPFPYAVVNINEQYMSKKDSQVLAAKIAIDIGAEEAVNFFGDVEHLEDAVSPKIIKCRIESDIMGSKHIVVIVEGMDAPFTVCSLHYSYGYTSNANIRAHSELVVEHLGYQGKIEDMNRMLG